MTIKERALNKAFSQLDKCRTELASFNPDGYPIVSKEQINMVKQVMEIDFEVATYIYLTLKNDI